MKKTVFVLAVVIGASFTACNNAKDNTDRAAVSPQAKADSLEKQVEEGHNIAMPKSMKIPKLQKETQRLIDSIGKLPAKAQVAAAPYKAKLEQLQKDLGSAYTSMEKWMNEFDFDSARDNLEQRIKYLTDEKLRVY